MRRCSTPRAAMPGQTTSCPLPCPAFFPLRTAMSIPDTPSAAASNTCSRRTGPPRPSTCSRTSTARPIPWVVSPSIPAPPNSARSRLASTIISDEQPLWLSRTGRRRTTTLQQTEPRFSGAFCLQVHTTIADCVCRRLVPPTRTNAACRMGGAKTIPINCCFGAQGVGFAALYPPYGTCASLNDRSVHKSFRILKELPHDLVVIGVFYLHRLQSVLRQPQQRGIWVSHQHRRVGGHDDLAMADVFHPPHQLQERDLARGRQRGFRFVEDEDALALAAFLEEAQKAFAVGMGEEVGRWASSHWIFLGHLVQVSGDREKAFGAEKPAISDFGQPACPQRAGQSTSHFFQRP